MEEDMITRFMYTGYPNLFGKWSRPNYKSVVSTFCHKIANNLDIAISDRNNVLELAYIDDLLEEFLCTLKDVPTYQRKYCKVPVTHKISLGELADTLYAFKDTRNNLTVPNMANPLVKKLYSTYLTYLSNDHFTYDLIEDKDSRGKFAEIIRTIDRGQFSVNISKPGITKSNHWHHTKNEKFLVVHGQGIVKFRNLHDGDAFEYHLSSDKLQVLDVPPGNTHSIINTGQDDMVVLIWANEPFDKNNPDTFFKVV